MRRRAPSFPGREGILDRTSVHVRIQIPILRGSRQPIKDIALMAPIENGRGAQCGFRGWNTCLGLEDRNGL